MAGYDRSLYQTYLSNIPMFRSCTTEQLDRLAELGTAVNRSDADVVTEGDRGDDFFVITSGKGRVTRAGREVAELGPGDYFGELALVSERVRSASVVADTEMRCYTIQFWNFRKFAKNNPDVTWKLLQHVTDLLIEERERRLRAASLSSG